MNVEPRWRTRSVPFRGISPQLLRSHAASDKGYSVPVADAWERYREMRTSAHTGESELRALEDAFLSGARAAFNTLDASLRAADDPGELALLLARWRLDLAIDESD